MKFTLRAKTHSLKGSIDLPASKSISNRVLIIQALAQKPFKIENLSKADDTIIMQQALERNDLITDVGPAGTAMRFLTAYYASQPGEKILTGSDRMKERPIKILVDALRDLGASITYLEKEGYPPLHIEGRRLQGGTVKVAGNISSQFITALMLVGPTLPQPLIIEIQGDSLSRPYIKMTQSLMESCGAQVKIESDRIEIKPGRYRSNGYYVEQDWSAAAFWMAFASLARKSNLVLKNLTDKSIQGDRAALDLFAQFGIKGQFTEAGLEVTKGGSKQEHIEWNFRNHPDLVQPAAFAAAASQIKFMFNGLDNLRLKETDRISALQNELAKLGTFCRVMGHSMEIEPTQRPESIEPIETYSDHRMAMSAACLSLVVNELTILDPMVVSKSYPGFWSQVEKYVDLKPGK
ncbi:MAG: 3-phosphoshikimate 1-carboxyvinyltransferase [Flavobacteriales bacterium]